MTGNSIYARYGNDHDGWMLFRRICPICGRFIIADKVVHYKNGVEYKSNGTCKKHGRIKMPFEEFI